MSPLVERLRVVGGALPLPPGLDGGRLEDLRPGLGPLSGIHAALASAASESVLVVACDLPFVTTELLRELARPLAPDEDAAAPRTSEGPLPVCAVYRRRCLSPLEAYLAKGARSARGFLESLAVRWLEGDGLARLDPLGRTLWNVNTPADYEAAVSLAEEE
jgi:molybdopterin-guanine dinucleotide biosynthesis protein A